MSQSGPQAKSSPDQQTMTAGQVEEEGVTDWRMLFATLHARFDTGDFSTGLKLVERIGAAAEEANHHPDLDLKYPHLDVRLSSHDVGGVTQRDLRLARRISQYAAELDVTADPSKVQVLELALDTADHEAVKPFWAAVLDLQPSQAHDDELRDDDGALPTLWFQRTDAHDEPRQRFHLDIRVPADLAQARVDAALDAGGTLISDDDAPTYWVLADAEGNKACVTTWQGRSHPGA